MNREALKARDLLENWVELAERTMRDHPFCFDANRTVDFMQGVRETRAFLSALIAQTEEGE